MHLSVNSYGLTTPDDRTVLYLFYTLILSVYWLLYYLFVNFYVIQTFLYLEKRVKVAGLSRKLDHDEANPCQRGSEGKHQLGRFPNWNPDFHNIHFVPRVMMHCRNYNSSALIYTFPLLNLFAINLSITSRSNILPFLTSV